MKRDLSFLEKKADDKWSQPVRTTKPSSMTVKQSQVSIEVGGQAGVINQIDEDHIETLVREIVSANNLSMVTEMVKNQVEQSVAEAKAEITREAVVEVETLENLQDAITTLEEHMDDKFTKQIDAILKQVSKDGEDLKSFILDMKGIQKNQEVLLDLYEEQKKVEEEHRKLIDKLFVKLEERNLTVATLNEKHMQLHEQVDLVKQELGMDLSKKMQ